jgi:DNA-binding NarL/FixJ family response regulator
MNDRVLRVIVADDHPVFRQGLRASLSAENDIEVVAECGDGPTVVATATTALPDVVLMDIRMPEMNGIEATGRILSAAPGTRIVMLTMFDDEESVFEAMRAGARGYLLKGSEPADIARAVRSVAEGDAIFGPAIAERMMALFARRIARPFPVLTEREHAVLEMIADGRNNQAIAHELQLSVKTVRNYVSMIFNKLQVADRAEAMLKAHAAGLGRNQA